jgi:uncharacterized membrane protein required for colicin V production
MTGFISLVILFGVIGSLRGWAKEIIVAFSVILALFVEHVLLTFVPPLKGIFDNISPQGQFYTRTVLFIIITVFGYASPTIIPRLGARVARERLQDILLGFFIGLLNGFLIVGTLLSFLDTAHYGVPQDMWGEQQKTDNGNPVMRDGKPVMETVYLPDATGIGGIVPPEPDSPSANLMAFLPPEWIKESEAILYISVAAAFIFVIIVFI